METNQIRDDFVSKFDENLVNHMIDQAAKICVGDCPTPGELVACLEDDRTFWLYLVVNDTATVRDSEGNFILFPYAKLFSLEHARDVTYTLLLRLN